MLQQWNLTGQEAELLVSDAVYDAVLGNCEAMRNASETASLPYLNGWQLFYPPALGLALCGEPAQAQGIASDLAKQFRMNTVWNSVKAPSIQAVVELRRNNPAKAIELLTSAARYERVYPYVMYFRGLAYLKAREASQAGIEFQKILDHRGANWLSVSGGPYYPLSYLGLARAAVLSGDKAKAKKAYQDFLTLWKDADPDLKPLIEARKEYAALQ